GYCKFPGDYDWPNDCFVALRDGVGQAFAATQLVISGQQSATTVSSNFAFQADTRNFTRLLKHPSGELPSEAPTELAVGTEIVGGTGTARAAGGGEGAMFDEVRVVNASDPH